MISNVQVTLLCFRCKQNIAPDKKGLHIETSGNHGVVCPNHSLSFQECTLMFLSIREMWARSWDEWQIFKSKCRNGPKENREEIIARNSEQTYCYSR